MARAVSVSTVASTPPLLSKSRRLLRGGRALRPFRCSAAPPAGEGDDGAPSLLKLAVGGVTELLRILYPNKARSRHGIEEVVEVPLMAGSVDDVLQILRSDYERAYFLTGNFTSDLYADDCLFEDPTIKFRGKVKYTQNLDLLVPFFDTPSLELENIEKVCNYDINSILAKWKLRTYLRFPWRPLIAIKGTTIYDLDREFKIVRHAESWNVSALEAVGQIFALGSGEGD